MTGPTMPEVISEQSQPQQEQREAPVSARRRLLLALTPAAIFGLYFIIRTRGTTPSGESRWILFDDAMISMSYARTFAQTGELVWFPGADRVEGITNPLWTMYMALLHLLGLPANAIVLTVSITGLACVLATGWLTYHIARSLTSNETLCLTVAVVSSFTYSFVFWSLRGMEVGPLTLCAVAAIYFAVKLRDEPRIRTLLSLCAVIVIGGLLRFDFIIIAAVVSVWLLLVSSGARNKVLYGFTPGVVAAGTVAAITAFRYAYYGEVFPNTYTLKMTGVSIGDRLARGLDTDLKLVAFLLLAVAGATIIGFLRPHLFKDRQIVWMLLGVTVVTVLYSTYVGGDAWEFFPNRYVVPGVITGNILAVVGVGQILTGRHGKRLGSALMVAVLVLLSTSLPAYYEWIQTRGLYVYGDHIVADWSTTLRQEGIADDGAVIAVMTAGSSQYYSELPAVDVLGKSDPVIARAAPRKVFLPGHDRWDFDHTVLGLRPDIVTNLGFVTEDEWARILEQYEFYCMDFIGQSESTVKYFLVLNGSPHVDVAKLRTCPPERPQKELGWYLKP